MIKIVRFFSIEGFDSGGLVLVETLMLMPFLYVD